MSNFELPAPIATYFASKGSHDLETTLACFTEDATVWDKGEDRELKGVGQIRKWMAGTVAGYNLSSTVVSGEQVDSDYVAGVVVVGDFPGSPYKFEYRFSLNEHKIASLTIDPIGPLAE